MDLNRNQFFFIGMLILFVGLQFRCVSAYVLNADATQFLAERTGQTTQATATSYFDSAGNSAAGPRRTLQPPEWLGWCVISIGSVLILHSLAMKRPD